MQLDTVLAGVAAYAGDSAQLPPPDRFAKEVILAVPGFFGRVRLLDFLHTRAESYDVCLERLGSIEAVVQEIRASASFRDLLVDYILPLGNKLNAHGRKAAVRGGPCRCRCIVSSHSLPFLPHRFRLPVFAWRLSAPSGQPRTQRVRDAGTDRRPGALPLCNALPLTCTDRRDRAALPRCGPLGDGP